jgi:hypothetical protein
LTNLQGLQQQGFGFGEAVLVAVECCQIVEAVGDIGMAIAQEVFSQLQGFDIQGFSRIVASLGVVE